MSKLTKKELGEIAKALSDIEEEKRIKENIAYKKKRVKTILNHHASRCNQKSYILQHLLEITNSSVDFEKFIDFESFHDYYINSDDTDFEEDCVYIHMYSKFKDYQFYQCIERIRDFIGKDPYFK